MVVKGKLIKAKYEAKQFKGRKEDKEKWQITIAETSLTDEQMQELQEAFKESGKQFTPDYVKDFKGYINVSSEYDVPIRWTDGTEMTLEKLTSEYNSYIGAEIGLCLRVKTGAVYPKSIVFYSDGEPFNPFDEFDN